MGGGGKQRHEAPLPLSKGLGRPGARGGSSRGTPPSPFKAQSRAVPRRSHKRLWYTNPPTPPLPGSVPGRVRRYPPTHTPVEHSQSDGNPTPPGEHNGPVTRSNRPRPRPLGVVGVQTKRSWHSSVHCLVLETTFRDQGSERCRSTVIRTVAHQRPLSSLDQYPAACGGIPPHTRRGNIAKATAAPHPKQHLPTRGHMIHKTTQKLPVGVRVQLY